MKKFVLGMLVGLSAAGATLSAESLSYEDRMSHATTRQEMEGIIVDLRIKIDAAHRVGDTNQVAYLERMLEGMLNRIHVFDMHHNDLTQENKLLRVSARHTHGEWKEFWENAGTATAVLILAAVTIPTVALLWRVVYMTWNEPTNTHVSWRFRV